MRGVVGGGGGVCGAGGGLCFYWIISEGIDGWLVGLWELNRG